jgi:hypothetical protein
MFLVLGMWSGRIITDWIWEKCEVVCKTKQGFAGRGFWAEDVRIRGLQVRKKWRNS